MQFKPISSSNSNNVYWKAEKMLWSKLESDWMYIFIMSMKLKIITLKMLFEARNNDLRNVISSWFCTIKAKDYPKFVRDSKSGFKLLTFQLSNVRGLETIKYASEVINHAYPFKERLLYLIQNIFKTILLLNEKLMQHTECCIERFR